MARRSRGPTDKLYEGRNFRVKIGKQQVLLIVDAPKDDVAPVTIGEVRQFFENQGWPWNQEQRIKTILKQHDGEAHVIENDLTSIKSDAKLHIRIAGDRMRVYGRLVPPIWGNQVTMEMARQSLREMGVIFGIQNDALQQMIAAQMDGNKEWTLAIGQAPQAGANARLQYEQSIQKTGGTPSFLPDGRVDFRELDNIVAVNEGQVLATKIPPTPGMPGRNVLNEEIPPVAGKDLVWPLGKGVSVVDNRMLAAIAGQVIIKGGRINVLPVYDVSGDVDYSTGNIRFNGNVFIRGSIKPGFTIHAEGDVKVAGGINCAQISCGGTLTVGGGIQGQGQGVVQVEGDVFTRFIENCQVTAGGAIVVGEDIMHSQVYAGRSIQVGGRKGLIVGGVIRATDSVECKVLGASMGTPTVLEVGVNPGAHDQLGMLQANKRNAEAELAKLGQGVRHLQQQADGGQLAASRQAMLEQLRKAYEQRSQEISEMAWQLSQYELAIAAIKDACVKVTEMVYPGIKVGIGKSIYRTHETKRGGVFKLQAGDVAFKQE